MTNLENINKSGKQFTLKYQEQVANNEILDDKEDRAKIMEEVTGTKPI